LVDTFTGIVPPESLDQLLPAVQSVPFDPRQWAIGLEPIAEATEENASSAARKAAMTGNTKVFFMGAEV
jgi:hypothetical protein